MTDMIDEQRTLFEIPAENMQKFEAQIAKISRKAERLLGSGFKPFVFSHEERELADGKKHRIYSVLLNAEVPKLNGWSFVARLDHSNETGTIIRMVPNAGELPESYRSASSTTCDHCNQKRYRRDTFVVHNDETGEFKQVGSTCLKDFFDGEDPFKIAKLAELLGYARECGHGAEHFVGGDLRWIDLEDFLGHAAAMIRTHGWVSGKAAYEDDRLTSTRDRTWTNFTHGRQLVLDADHDLVTEALEWATSLRQKDVMSDYEHNISVIADATMIEPRSAGLAVSIVGVFYNNKLRTQQVQKTVDVGDMSGVINLFQTASKNLKWPKIRLALEDGTPIVLTVAGPNSKAPGTVNITDGGPFGSNIWYGRVTPEGVWDRSRSVQGQTMTSLTALLTALSHDPAGTASKHGKMTGQCCFCSRPLDDARSTAVGYGKVCASKYELPWGSK